VHKEEGVRKQLGLTAEAWELGECLNIVLKRSSAGVLTGRPCHLLKPSS